MMLYIDELFIFPPFSTWTQWMTVIKWLCCLWWNLMHATLWYLYVFRLHFPVIMCIVSTIYMMFNCWFLYLVLLNLYLRDPSLERKANFFLKWFLLLPLGFTFCNLGTFWVITPGSWDLFMRGMCARKKWLPSADSGKRTHKKKLD